MRISPSFATKSVSGTHLGLWVHTLHLTGHLQLLHKFTSHPPCSISVANNNSVMSYCSGILHGHIMIDGRLEPVQIKNFHQVPDIPHTLISPLQLEENGLDLQWCRGYGIEFYQGTRLRLYTIRHGWHIILPICLDLIDSVAVAQMPPAGVSAAMLAADLDLIHHCL